MEIFSLATLKPEAERNFTGSTTPMEGGGHSSIPHFVWQYLQNRKTKTVYRPMQATSSWGQRGVCMSLVYTSWKHCRNGILTYDIVMSMDVRIGWHVPHLIGHRYQPWPLIGCLVWSLTGVTLTVFLLKCTLGRGAMQLMRTHIHVNVQLISWDTYRDFPKTFKYSM